MNFSTFNKRLRSGRVGVVAGLSISGYVNHREEVQLVWLCYDSSTPVSTHTIIQGVAAGQGGRGS